MSVYTLHYYIFKKIFWNTIASGKVAINHDAEQA